MPMLLLVGGCVASPPIFAPDSPCSQLVPQDWRGGVKSASPAPLADDASDAAMGIVERCEARDATAVKRAKPKFLGIF